MSVIGFYINKEKESIKLEDVNDYTIFTTVKKNIGQPIDPLYIAILKNQILNDQKHSSRDSLDKWHVTSLLGCIREAYLKKTEDYYVFPEDFAFRLRGTIIHEILELLRDNPDFLIEQNVSGEINGVEIVGRYDYFDRKHNIRGDVKSQSDYCIKQKDRKLYYFKNIQSERLDWIRQLQLYDYLDKEHKADVFRIHIATNSNMMLPINVKPEPEELFNSFITGQTEKIKTAKEKGVTTLPYDGEKMFNGKKCNKYCDVCNACKGV